jgi:hypothetical protein
MMFDECANGKCVRADAIIAKARKRGDLIVPLAMDMEALALQAAECCVHDHACEDGDSCTHTGGKHEEAESGAASIVEEETAEEEEEDDGWTTVSKKKKKGKNKKRGGKR